MRRENCGNQKTPSSKEDEVGGGKKRKEDRKSDREKKGKIKERKEGTVGKMKVVVTVMTITIMPILSPNSALETIVIFSYMLETVTKHTDFQFISRFSQNVSFHTCLTFSEQTPN
jgi:hypothetical protein